ncbi:MAG: SprB repeat-containing protein, partial [Bacteroidota bacterium]
MRQMKFTLQSNRLFTSLGEWMLQAGLVLPLVCFFLLGHTSSQAQITAGITVNSNVLCTGGSDGSLTAQGFGGWPPYTYTWSTGDTTQTISGLSAGTYTVTVQDIDLALFVVSATIFEPPPLGVILQPSGGCAPNSGTINTVTFQGTPPYTYVWSDGQTTATAVGLDAGMYSVTVTDANGCTVSESTTVVTSNSSNISLLTTASFETCAGSSDATATVVVQSGGVPPYTYLWSDGQTTDIAVGLTSGQYSVTVTDANGCTAEATQIVELSPEGIWLMVTSTDAVCGEDNGTAYVGIMTGVPPFTILWSNGNMTTNPTGLAPGTYSVTVTDSNGCTNADSVVVNGIDAPEAGFILTSDTTTFCVTDGQDDIVTVTATGATGDNFRFVVTDSDGKILVITTDNVFNFEGVP